MSRHDNEKAVILVDQVPDGIGRLNKPSKFGKFLKSRLTGNLNADGCDRGNGILNSCCFHTNLLFSQTNRKWSQPPLRDTALGLGAMRTEFFSKCLFLVPNTAQACCLPPSSYAQEQFMLPPLV